MPLNREDAARAIALNEDGRSSRYVARVININVSTFQRAYQRFRETGSYCRMPGPGRKRSTTTKDDQFLKLQFLRDRHTTAVEA